MSVSAMANAAMRRRTDQAERARAPASFTEIAQGVGAQPPPENAVSAALSVIVTYIPMEIITLYVALLAMIRPATTPPEPTTGEWVMFWLFLLATPLVTWILFATKLKTAGRELPLHPRQWPLWELIAGTIAFTAWAFALPSPPFRAFEFYVPALGGGMVLVVSTALGLLTPLVQRPLPAE